MPDSKRVNDHAAGTRQKQRRVGDEDSDAAAGPAPVVVTAAAAAAAATKPMKIIPDVRLATFIHTFLHSATYSAFSHHRRTRIHARWHCKSSRYPLTHPHTLPPHTSTRELTPTGRKGESHRVHLRPCQETRCWNGWTSGARQIVSGKSQVSSCLPPSPLLAPFPLPQPPTHPLQSSSLPSVYPVGVCVRGSGGAGEGGARRVCVWG